jgi:hypothetical protein
MDHESERETAPSGDLSVPPRKPPTAVGVATPPNPDWHRRSQRRRRHWIARLLSDTLNVVAKLGSMVAAKLHLRPTR